MTDTLPPIGKIDSMLSEALRATQSGNEVEWVGLDETALAAVWPRVEYHGVALLLHEKAYLLRDWPQPLLGRIAEEARLIALWEATHLDCIVPLVEALDDNGVETVFMKGTNIAYSHYKVPAARRRCDSDMLVRPADLSKTREVLASQGWYRRNDPHGLNFQESWLHDAAGFFVHSLDLHWRPSDRPALHDVLRENEFFEFKRPLLRLSGRAFGVDPVVTLVHEAINQAWHFNNGYYAEEGRVTGSRRLIWSVDFDYIARGMSDDDWNHLIDFCQDRQVGALVAEALLGAADDLRTALLPDAMEQLAACPTGHNIARYLNTADSLGEFMLDLRTAKTWKFRWQLIAKRAFAPRTHLLEKYPAARSWPTLLLQGRLILETLMRFAKRLVTR